MSVPHFLRGRPALVPSFVLSLALSGWAGAAVAADHAVAHVPKARAPVAKVAAGPAPTPVAAAASAPADKKARRARADTSASAADEARDPLDVLREKLAQKLGATRAPDTPNPNVVRVTSKNTETTAPAHGAMALAARATRSAARQSATGIGAANPAHAPHPAHPMHWDYAGRGGPETWGQLKPEFSACSRGTRQSPIDIRDGIKVELDAVQFDYKPSSFRVLDTGHTVQVNVAAGNSIEVMGRRYELQQFHFHRPSEERIEGKQFEMAVHLVHKDSDGRLAFVAVLLERGRAQPVVQSVWNNLPLEKGEEVPARSLLNLNDLLPTERSYFTYMGSLTTPPCSEGVLWMVMKTPVPVSGEQAGIFARLYPMNARPVQAAGGRLIKESN